MSVVWRSGRARPEGRVRWSESRLFRRQATSRQGGWRVGQPLHEHLINYRVRIAANGGAEPDKIDHIEAKLAGFELGDIGLGTSRAGGDIGLAQASRRPFAPQSVAEPLVFN